jgi:L-alanine-DL-glutamate epimerase-like enolase superfamily enzyme
MEPSEAVDTTGIDTTVERVELTTVKLPMRETPFRHFGSLRKWRYMHLVELELDSGHVGQGELIRYYWVPGAVRDEQLDRVEGADAARAMWNDDFGFAIQTALFDAVGRALGVPIHALLGDQVRDRVPIAWWCNVLPPEDLAAEGERAIDAGYTHIKMKGRAWRDIREQLDALSDAIPESTSVNVDFNYTLQDAERAPDVIRDIIDTPQLDVLESPIHADDLEGARRLRDEFGDRLDFARHYGRPSEREALCSDVADGMIHDDHPRGAIRAGDACGATGHHLTFQLTGSQVSTLMGVHLAAVTDAADWPIVTCENTYADTLLDTELKLVDGGIPVPEGPGLGARLDPDKVAEYEVEEPDEEPSHPKLLEISFPDGRTMYFDGSLQRQWNDELPYHVPGVTARIVPKDEEGREAKFERATEEGPFFA